MKKATFKRTPLATKVKPPHKQARRKARKAKCGAPKRQEFNQHTSWNEPGFVGTFRMML